MILIVMDTKTNSREFRLRMLLEAALAVLKSGDEDRTQGSQPEEVDAATPATTPAKVDRRFKGPFKGAGGRPTISLPKAEQTNVHEGDVREVCNRDMVSEEGIVVPVGTKLTVLDEARGFSGYRCVFKEAGGNRKLHTVVIGRTVLKGRGKLITRA